MPDEAWGNFSWPFINTWEYPASNDCQRITPEPTDGSTPTFVKDDDMIETRTMGQFIALPDGKMLVLNGGLNGTAGYSTITLLTQSYADMPYGMSLASGAVGRPSIYDPDAPAGSRWSSEGLGTSNIPRLYHSTALLLPDASVFIAGSNPNVDVNMSTYYPTTYKGEIFYPPYFNSTTRPVPQNVPTTLSYGGNPFDITVAGSSYGGSANTAADNTKIMVIRPGFTTHAMNMGQRSLQLNNTYTVNDDGSIVYHVSQMPPNANIFQPGPAFLFVTINGIPSNGTYVIVGSGNIEKQTLNPVGSLPASVRSNNAQGSGSSGTNSSGSGSGSDHGSASSLSGGAIGGIIGGAVALLALIGALSAIFISRRRRRAVRGQPSGGENPEMSGRGGAGPLGAVPFDRPGSDSSSLLPSSQPYSATSHHDAGSRVNLVSPYIDASGARSGEFNPYDELPPRTSTSAGPTRY